MEEVRLREVPERVVLVERRKVVVAHVHPFIAEALARQRALLDEAGVAPPAPSWAAFVSPVTDETVGIVEVCTPVPDELARRAGLELRVEPVHREAYTTLTSGEAAYPAVLDAYALVELWVAQSGLTLAGSPRESYFADGAAAGDDDPVVDVAQPVL